jgi:hypothetical protein
MEWAEKLVFKFILQGNTVANSSAEAGFAFGSGGKPVAIRGSSPQHAFLG